MVVLRFLWPSDSCLVLPNCTSFSWCQCPRPTRDCQGKSGLYCGLHRSIPTEPIQPNNPQLVARDHVACAAFQVVVTDEDVVFVKVYRGVV